ncbi:hypothetical protein NECID01_0087 [Nematocida sp. AWRm77]|nr:hypothetical protein NECID01_0087 [Nematocida sp. AWRm77]
MSTETNKALLELLRKHKLVGVPVEWTVSPEDTKAEVVQRLSQEKFFRKLEECEKRGVLLGYDGLVECTELWKEKTKQSVQEACARLGKQLEKVFQDELDSFYIGELNGKVYLHIKYRGRLSNLWVGPVVNLSLRTQEEKTFRALWEPEIEHRRFEDGKIRICASFLHHPSHAMPYVLLSRVVGMQAENGRISTDSALGLGRSLMPVIPTENTQNMYNAHNKPGGEEFIKQTFDRVKDSAPVSVLQNYITGSFSRKTRVCGNTQAQVYLKLDGTHKWPVEHTEMFANALTAMNSIFANVLRHKKIEVEGISPEGTLHVKFAGERAEMIFSIESEAKVNPQKYALMNFRIEYDKFFHQVSRENPVFPEICVLVKQLLFAHGLYPYHVSDKTVELLCLRTAVNCRTLEGGFKAVLSTQYAHGYSIDIRKGKTKVCARGNEQVSVTHELGVFSYLLPEKKVFAAMNAVFYKAAARIESFPGMNTSYALTPVFNNLFVPSMDHADFSLSRIPLKSYTEVDHYTTALGGCMKTSSIQHCFSALKEQGCTAYFCGTEKLLVCVEDKEKVPLVLGMSLFLTGMRYVRFLADG